MKSTKSSRISKRKTKAIEYRRVLAVRTNLLDQARETLTYQTLGARNPEPEVFDMIVSLGGTSICVRRKSVEDVTPGK